MLVRRRQIRSSMGAVVHVESAARMLWSSLPRTQPPGMWQSCYEGAVGVLDLHGRHLTARRVPKAARTMG